MSYQTNDQELANVVALSPHERIQYFVSKVTDWEEVWSIKSDQGWSLSATDDGVEAVPVWPAKDYASLMCNGAWDNDKAASISLDDWMDKWLPGILADGRLVAVFPVPGGKSFVIHPEELKRLLADYIEDTYG